MGRIYGKVQSPEDISRINCIIRDEMMIVETVEQLTELKKRSDYLCTLTHSPFWKKKFGPMIENLKEVALIENRITVQMANYIAKYHNWDKHYDAWGDDDETLDEKLDNLPQEVVKEITESTINLALLPEILEQIRKSFCRIRAAMLFVDDKEELTQLKVQSDLIVALVKTEDFRSRFLDVISEIDELVEKEEGRTIKLANIVAEVNSWQVEYIAWDYNQLQEGESLEDYIKRLIQEEQKAESYIPSEAKYTYGARTIWLVYKHPSRNRVYAKRVYIPETARNITFDGPGVFENRFGKKVYGVRLQYEVFVRPTTIHRNNVEIQLPARWVKKYKVVELPKGVENIKIEEEKPEEAYPVA